MMSMNMAGPIGHAVSAMTPCPSHIRAIAPTLWVCLAALTGLLSSKNMPPPVYTHCLVFAARSTQSPPLRSHQLNGPAAGPPA